MDFIIDVFCQTIQIQEVFQSLFIFFKDIFHRWACHNIFVWFSKHSSCCRVFSIIQCDFQNLFNTEPRSFCCEIPFSRNRCLNTAIRTPVNQILFSNTHLSQNFYKCFIIIKCRHSTFVFNRCLQRIHKHFICRSIKALDWHRRCD